MPKVLAKSQQMFGSVWEHSCHPGGELGFQRPHHSYILRSTQRISEQEDSCATPFHCLARFWGPGASHISAEIRQKGDVVQAN